VIRDFDSAAVAAELREELFHLDIAAHYDIEVF
jgi:hypothetical protein